MRITLLTIGTLGDVRPFLALALGLQKLGHQVNLAGPENFISYVEPYQVPYHSLEVDTKQLLESEEGKRWMAAGNVNKFMEELQKMFHERRYILERDILAACQDNDLIITHPLLLFHAATLSEKFHIPLMLATPFPDSPKTKEFPQFLVRSKKLPFGFLNLLTYFLFAKVYEKSKRRDLNEWRIKLGLSPLRGSVFANIVKQHIPILHAYSNELVPFPKDWSEHNFITGNWKIPEKSIEHTEDHLPEELLAWLEAGKAPIYFGFGSLPILEPQKMINMAIEIANNLQTRAIIASGWSDMIAKDLPYTDSDSIFMLKSANHELLFPHCSIIIHHGGAGTTHTTLESGVPSIICSTYADQPFWGERITEINIGRHIPFPKLTKQNLTDAILELHNNSVIEKAAEIGKRMKSENGLQNALEIINTHLERGLPVYRN
ncbi:glycosyltransferase [Evansella sp. AB-P1]|uniref:glycosyltransferase n=1 Tax=Evansella sp. AB-P1 TaxID=3037653 RepID=UPI00241C04C9|nr:glycosyltransferase [Evansella sp. AB-P1]MDG5789625.1 glycosyltransferase [Evansella sp. AB-P1]